MCDYRFRSISVCWDEKVFTYWSEGNLQNASVFQLNLWILDFFSCQIILFVAENGMESYPTGICGKCYKCYRIRYQIIARKYSHRKMTIVMSVIWDSGSEWANMNGKCQNNDKYSPAFIHPANNNNNNGKKRWILKLFLYNINGKSHNSHKFSRIVQI